MADPECPVAQESRNSLGGGQSTDHLRKICCDATVAKHSKDRTMEYRQTLLDIAKRYRDKFRHVFVDEYQDINDVQNAIIKLIQRDTNDFLVGDVKQCIYMFRESNPDLLKKRCKELADSGLIEMNINYRSERKIIDFINGVMHFMMSENAGGVEYKGGQRLEAAKQGEGQVEIVLVDIRDKDSIISEGGEIARCIKKLKADGYKYKDIAILRPEVSNTGKDIAKILSDMDIPVVRGFDSVDTSFSEISVFINLLSLIDRGTSDIALLSVMRYPHFGFTETELAKIRIKQQTRKTDEDKSFFHAVRTFREDSELFEKVQRFLDEIANYKKLSEALMLPDFLMRLRLLAEFSEYAITSPGGVSAPSPCSPVKASPVAFPTVTGRSHTFPLWSNVP